MQLILCTDIDIGINNKMSSINEESLNDKDGTTHLVEKVINEIENGNKENLGKKDNIITDCDEKGDNNSNCHDVVSEDIHNDKIAIKEEENIISEKIIISHESSANSPTEIETVNSKADVQISAGSSTVNAECESSKFDQVEENGSEEVEDKIINIPSVEENEILQTEVRDVDLTNNADPLIESKSFEFDSNRKSDEEESSDIANKYNNVEKSSLVTSNDEIIDIADDKPGNDSSEDNMDLQVVENSVENVVNLDKNIIDIADDKLANDNQEDTMNRQVVENVVNLDKNIIDIADDKPANNSPEDSMDMQVVENSVENVVDLDKNIPDVSSKTNKKVNCVSIIENESSKINMVADTDNCNPLENNVIQIDSTNETCDVSVNKTRRESINEMKMTEKKKLTLLSNLSNTLDILSDDDEDPLIGNESQKEVSQNEITINATDKQCINIEDDDDIMVIDDEATVKEIKSITKDDDKPIIETKLDTRQPVLEDTKIDCDITQDERGTITNKETEAVIPESNEPKIEDQEDLKTKKKVELNKPLLPVTFLKTCKKNVADMTRDELEEFCIIKIVESVVDRSNLGDIKSQLKTMGQNIEEYKNITKMLTKQNRDLQVVLKSVQEEQKKKSGTAITPLKITRSVGIQVLMDDKLSRKRVSLGFNSNANSPNAPSSTTRQNRAQSQASKNAKTANTPQIPVPRLVPAVNNNSKNNSNSLPQNSNNAPKIQTPNNVANGLKGAPAQKPEKRSHGKMQQNSAVTVDLTDDEPPAKIATRNATTSVRCVLPQNLLAPRQPLAQTANSPRKVYIPISGPQSQNGVRTGQTIMVKAITPQNTRPRASAPTKTAPNANSTRMGRVAFKHPAPLPDSMKQYQPPNWKALPPSPELKLSKVENGIVISWKIDAYQEDNHEEIASYQLFAYQETPMCPPSTSLWKKIGDVKALPLPMACTLTQFMAGYKYYFAVRAVDIRSRFGPFSAPGSILLLNNV